MDSVMPVMNGLDATRLLRVQCGCRAVIIGVTGA
jgi:CheY-like chemotaxis protein